MYDFYCITGNPNIILFVAPFTSTLIMVKTRCFDCLWSITIEDKHQCLSMLGCWLDTWSYSQLICFFFPQCLLLWIYFLILWLHKVRWRGYFYHISIEGWEELLIEFQPLEWDFIAQCSHNKVYVLFLAAYLQKLHFKHWSRSKNIHLLNIHHQNIESIKTT